MSNAKRIIDENLVQGVINVIQAATHPKIPFGDVLSLLQQFAAAPFYQEAKDEKESRVQGGSEEDCGKRGCEQESSGSDSSELNAQSVSGCEEGQSCS